jgi:hypothetical protein
MIEAERLAFAFVLAGNRAAMSPFAQRRLSPVGLALLDVCATLTPAVRMIGLEASTRVWRRTLLPIDRDRLIPNVRLYALVLRAARMIDRTTCAELAGILSPGTLLDSPSIGARPRAERAA